MFSKNLGNNKITYPLTGDQIQKLKPCRIVNPKIGNSHGFKIPDFFDLQKSCEEVLKVRAYVESGEFPYWFMDKYNPFKEAFGEFPRKTLGPLLLRNLSFDDPKGLANVVHMDKTMDVGNAIHDWLLNNKYNVKPWSSDHINFIETVPEVEHNLAKEIYKGINKAFEMKWYFGLERPEETLGYNMTYYPEGCPAHPSYPAGHATFSGSTGKSLIDSYQLDTKALKVILFTVYAWAMFRTFAGVHHAIDNIAGLIAGGLDPYMKSNIVNLYKI